MDAPVISIRDLVKEYATGVRALRGVSVEIKKGEIFGLLGPNGAGKTTLIGIVAGLVRKTSGEVRVLGKDVEKDYRFTRAHIGLVPQEINQDPFFTVEEVLKFQAGYFGVRKPEKRIEEILNELNLGEKRKSRGTHLSGGMKRRVMIAKALVHDPEILFLDEPTAGVDVELRANLWKLVRRLKEEGRTIILTTHYLEEAEELADRIAIINNGEIALVEEKEELMKRGDRLHDIYLEIVNESKEKASR
jgi:ABC-2 type transport system ATP-binding protein